MNNHLIHLPPGVIYLSVRDLPKVVIVSCYENEFNFDICCQSEQNVDLPTGADIEPPILVSDIQPPIVVCDSEPPIVVSDSEPPIVVSDSELPIVVSDSEPPIVVSDIQPPIVVSDIEPPIVVSDSELPVVVSDIEPPVVVSFVAQNVPADSTKSLLNEEVICVIDYKQELQGFVIINEEIPSHYYKMHIAIANTFVKYKYAFMILESYMMALIKHMECFYLIDSHARNCLGMPDPNGTAIVMQFANILDLEQYLYALSEALHSNLFEIVPVQFTEFVNNNSTKNVNFAYSVRLRKNREFQKAKRAEENDCERQNRLQNMREYINKKRCEESGLARQTRHDGAKLSQKRKRSVETDLERQKSSNKHAKRVPQAQSEPQVTQAQSEDNQNDYLTAFDNSENGGIEEQSWAKANINKFHKSMKYVVSQCTVCFEAWPLKSKPKAPYVCSRCFRDKKSQKKFSVENSLIPSSVPDELKDLTQIEEMLFARALPIMRVYIKRGGQRGYSGHCINLLQKVSELATCLPRYPRDLAVIIVKVNGIDNTFRDVTVRKQKVLNALLWLMNNNPHYNDITVNEDALQLLPDNGIPTDIMSVETEDDIVLEDDTPAAAGPPTDNPSEDVVYDDSTEMSSFLPVGF